MTPPRFTQHLIVLAAFVALLTPRLATAQGDFGTVRTAIDRNAELLAQATELVHETNSTKARAALETARKLHEGSITLLQNGNGLMAGRAAREAREAILRAIAIARQEVKLEENARHAIERARDHLERARAALDDGPANPSAGRLIEEARMQLRRSRDNMQEHMFETALRLANASRELSGRALQMLGRDDVSPERVRREITRTDNILARIRDRDAAQRPELRGLIEEATHLQERARESARSDAAALALRQTLRARALALRVLKISGDGNIDADAVARALELTDGILARARELSGEGEKHGAPQADPLEGAFRLQQQARDRQAGGELDAAMRLTLQAREAVKRVVRGMDRDVDASRVQRTLTETDAALERLRDQLAAEGNADARDLYDRATRRQAEAWKAFEAHELRRALAFTKVARNLATTALEGDRGADD